MSLFLMEKKSEWNISHFGEGAGCAQQTKAHDSDRARGEESIYPYRLTYQVTHSQMQTI